MLSPEEIARRRQDHFDKSAKRLELITQLENAFNLNDNKSFREILDKITSLDPLMCEHERHWSSNCIACESIHQECFPEYYNECSVCGEIIILDECDSKNRCLDCQD